MLFRVSDSLVNIDQFLKINETTNAPSQSWRYDHILAIANCSYAT
jgi:hypothetical protein